MKAKTIAPAPTCSKPTKTHPCTCPEFCRATGCTERRFRQVTRLARNPAAQRLAAVLAALEAAEEELRDLARGHGPGHNCDCELCRYVGEEFWEDVLVLRVNVEVGASVLGAELPANLLSNGAAALDDDRN